MKTLNKLLKKIFYFFRITVYTLPAFLLTAFIALNSYEVIFQKDLKYINAVQTFSSSKLIDDLSEATNSAFSARQKTTQIVHNPQALKFPSIKQRIEIIPAQKVNNQWVEMGNKGHYISLGENSESGIGNTIIYLKRDWRTILEPNDLKENNKFYLETSKYINSYKVIGFNVKAQNDNYVLNPLPRSYVLLVIEDPKNNVNYFVKAVFVNQERFI